MRHRIITATTPAEVDSARALFVEYQAWLGEVVCSHRLAEEIATLPGPYAAPGGRLLVAIDATGAASGVVGVRAHRDGACEMKRLFVRPAARGHGLGRCLAEGAITAALELGYTRVLLATLPDSMAVAESMYRRLGFTPTECFLDGPVSDDAARVAFLELRLTER